MKPLKFARIKYFYKSNKGIETSTNEWCRNDNIFNVFEDDTEAEDKNEDEMETQN